MKPINQKMIEMLSDRIEVICATYSFAKFNSRQEWQDFYDNAAREILEGLKGIFEEE